MKIDQQISQLNANRRLLPYTDSTPPVMYLLFRNQIQIKTTENLVLIRSYVQLV